MAFFGQLADEPGIEVRTHATTLYNSVYIFDQEMVVNPHVYGKTAPHAPAIHVRKMIPEGLFEAYAESFEVIWRAASPLQKDDVCA